jgi:phage terminase small subunit
MSRDVAARNDVLNPRERKFVELFVETSNATRSALAAGYGRNYQNAAVYANSLLKKPKIKNEVDKRNAEIMAELDFTPDRIIREIAKIAGVNTADFVTIDADGNPVVDFTDVTRRQLAAVASVESETYMEGRGDGARPVKRVKYKTHDKLKALTELAKMARLYPAERTELTGADGGPIQSASVNINHTMDIASLEPEQRDQLRSVLLAIKAKHESESSESEDDA